MRRIWRNIKGFEGYQVSNKGEIRSFWKRKHRSKGYGCDWIIGDEPYIMSASDDGNGYLKVMLTEHPSGKRYCRKIHKLVAEAFIPNDDPTKNTVDHRRSGPEGKLDNSVENLVWMSRLDNIRKAYRDGVCDRRIASQEKDIFMKDLWTGEEVYFSSIKEASEELHIDRSSISHVLRGDIERISHYTFEYADREGRALYGSDENKLLTWMSYGLR